MAPAVACLGRSIGLVSAPRPGGVARRSPRRDEHRNELGSMKKCICSSPVVASQQQESIGSDLIGSDRNNPFLARNGMEFNLDGYSKCGRLLACNARIGILSPRRDAKSDVFFLRTLCWCRNKIRMDGWTDSFLPVLCCCCCCCCRCGGSLVASRKNTTACASCCSRGRTSRTQR